MKQLEHSLKGGAGDAPLVVHYKEQTKEMLETILKHSSWEQLKYTYEQIGNLMQKNHIRKTNRRRQRINQKFVSQLRNL